MNKSEIKNLMCLENTQISIKSKKKKSEKNYKFIFKFLDNH